MRVWEKRQSCGDVDERNRLISLFTSITNSSRNLVPSADLEPSQKIHCTHGSCEDSGSQNIRIQGFADLGEGYVKSLKRKHFHETYV